MSWRAACCFVRSISRLIARSLRADATTGMVREMAAADNGIWVGRVRTAPGLPSGWHHHGDYETYFYVESGKMRMECGPGGSEVVEAGPGDSGHVPDGVIHREVNPADQEGAVILSSELEAALR